MAHGMARVINSAVHRRHIDADVPGGDRSFANVFQLDGRYVAPESATARALRCSFLLLCLCALASAHCVLLLPPSPTTLSSLYWCSVALALNLHRMEETTEADSMGLGAMKNVRGGSAEPSGACCGGGTCGEEENAACLGQGGADVIVTMRDGEATAMGNRGGSGSTRCVEMTDEKMEPSGLHCGQPPVPGPVGDDLDDGEKKVVKNNKSLASPPTSTGQHKGKMATTLGGSGLGEVGLESFTALVPVVEEDIGHSDGGRYVRVVCD